MRRAFLLLSLVLSGVLSGPPALAAAVDLQWMMAVEAGIPADIRVDRIFEDHGQIVVTGSAPRFVEIANYLRKIGSDGVGTPRLERVTPDGKVQSFVIRISRPAAPKRP